jgi:hypothetical protein
MTTAGTAIKLDIAMGDRGVAAGFIPWKMLS